MSLNNNTQNNTTRQTSDSFVCLPQPDHRRMKGRIISGGVYFPLSEVNDVSPKVYTPFFTLGIKAL